MKNKNKTIAYLLWLTGGFGGHRWYLGQKGLAILFMLTGGGLGIWWAIDLFRMDTIVNKANGLIFDKKKVNPIVIASKVVVLILMLVILGKVSNSTDNVKEVKAQEPKIEQTVPVQAKKEETVKEEVKYKTVKNFIHEQSAYSGKPVYEIEIYGQFDLNSPTLKEDALEILNKESEIGLKEQPTSEMVRVFIYQGDNSDNMNPLPVAVGTYDNSNGKLSLRYLQDKARFPIFNQLNK